MAKKMHSDDIDESFILASIKQDRKPDTVVPSPPISVPQSIPKVEEKAVEVETKDNEPKITKGIRKKIEQYEELFFRESPQAARLGKGITIRPEFHDTILKILQVVGGNQTSLFSYVDNILAHHFEIYKQELNELYDMRNEKPKTLI